MVDLKCSVTSCVYNTDNLCSKGDIMVGGKNASQSKDTRCESFMYKREDETSYSSSTCHPCQSISVDCEAEKCRYNSNYRCTAKHVDIMGGCNSCDCKETSCATFQEKQARFPKGQECLLLSQRQMLLYRKACYGSDCANGLSCYIQCSEGQQGQVHMTPIQWGIWTCPHCLTKLTVDKQKETC